MSPMYSKYPGWLEPVASNEAIDHCMIVLERYFNLQMEAYSMKKCLPTPMLRGTNPGR